MEIKFDVYFKKNLGTLFKNNEVDLNGLHAHTNLQLALVDRLEINYKVNGVKYTDDVVITDATENLIQIPFKSDVMKAGQSEFELVAYMKNGDIKVSQTYTYNIEEGIGEGKQSGSGGSSDGHTHNNLNVLNSITQTKVNEWNNKADSTHSHSEYASKSHNHNEYANVTHTHSNYASATHSHSEYANNNHTHNASEIEGLENIDIDLSDYYTKSETYNRTEIDNKMANIGSGGSVDLSNYYTKSETDEVINNKADKVHTHSEYLTEHQDISHKADKADTYTKTQTDNKISEEIDRQIADGTIANLTLSDKSVTMQKTDFFLVEMHNLFDKNRVTPGIVTGDDSNTNSSYLKTNYFIEVEPNTEYSFKNTSGDMGYWTKDKVYISRASGSKITTPENCYYMKITTTPTLVDTCMMVKGSTVPSEYIPYGSYSVNIPDEELKKAIGNSVSSEILDKNMPPITYNHTDFMELDYINLLNEDESEIGIMSTAGNIIYNEAYRASGFMKVEVGKKYKCTKNTADCCYFDKDKKPTRSAIGFATTNPPQEGDCFIRITYSKNDIGNIMFGEVDKLPSDYEPFGRYELKYKNESDAESLSKQFKGYILKSQLYGKKWCVIGDSISDTKDGRGRTTKFYQEYIQDETGIELYNWNGNGTGYVKEFNGQLGIKDRFDDIPSDSDIITILAGTNDNITLGNFGDSEPTTFYGAVDYVVKGIIDRFPTASFGVMTILPKQGDTNRINGSVRSYCNAIIEVCNKYCVPVLNLYDEVGFNPLNETFRSAMMPDGLHPNATGHERMARKIKPWLETL